jgi:hypothetical protein
MPYVAYQNHLNPYLKYYLDQAQNRVQSGGDMPAFAGVRYQRGHGLGAIFAKIRAALPWFFKSVGRQALQTGVDVAHDVLDGRKLREVIAPRLLEGAKRTAQDVGPTMLEGIKTTARGLLSQSGSGKRRKRSTNTKKKGCCKNKNKKRKFGRQGGGGGDIFG